MVHRLISGVDVDKETLAVDIIENVGPGGNYVTEEHTIKHMFRQFFYPTLAIRMNFDRWQEQNEPTPLTNAHELTRTWLEEVESVLSLEKLLEIKSKFPEIINT
jgi:trimethylamine--corrinoid protein Co-methyltransferase